MPKRKLKSAHKKLGLSPGSLVYLGDQSHAASEVRLASYSAEKYCAPQIINVTNIPSLSLETDIKHWLDISGLSNTDLVKQIGDRFGLHALSLEDLLNTTHRPKIDDFDHYYFVILKAITFDPQTLNFRSDQIVLTWGHNFVLSFHEGQLDILKSIYQRLEQGRGRIRKMPSDYLAYSILDAVVDNYFIAFEALDLTLEQLHQDILKDPQGSSVTTLHNLKRELQLLRHDLIPLREVLGHMVASDSELLHPETAPYIKDLNDHVLHALAELESARDNLSELAQYSMILLSNKVAQVTKVLTLIAAIFIPLTFLVGVYGMNFDHMPELHWRYGYHLIWSIMLVLSASLVYYFKKKHWF